MTRQEAIQQALNERQSVIESLLDTVSPENRGWYEAYVTENYAALVESVFQWKHTDFGFRGIEMKQELERRGLWRLGI
mgnify:CR=1 FL=1